jgi:hypothetical protein
MTRDLYQYHDALLPELTDCIASYVSYVNYMRYAKRNFTTIRGIALLVYLLFVWGLA